VPGFASMYRTEVLPHIDLNPPGLVIEDFNMTFEVYQKKLGKVAFTLSAVAVTQDPDRLHDYVKQTRRWAIGLWQTVKRHPPKANLFSAMLAVLLFELITSSAVFVLLPPILAVLFVPDLVPGALYWAPFADVHTVVAAHMRLSAVLFGVMIPDYAMTCLVAVLDRRARLLFYGLFFPVMRVIDAGIALSAVPAGWLTRSNGIWKSPPRRAIEAAPECGASAASVLPATVVAAELDQSDDDGGSGYEGDSGCEGDSGHEGDSGDDGDGGYELVRPGRARPADPGGSHFAGTGDAAMSGTELTIAPSYLRERGHASG